MAHKNSDSTEQTLDQALKVIAQAGQDTLDKRLRILDHKDQLRQMRRARRMLEKGY